MTLLLLSKTASYPSNILWFKLPTAYLSLGRFSSGSLCPCRSSSSFHVPTDAQYSNSEHFRESEQSSSLQITPRVLKDYLDQYVIGQERAKKVLSVAVFNHYQRTDPYRQQEGEKEKQIRMELAQALQMKASSTISHLDPRKVDGSSVRSVTSPLSSPAPEIEKANILLLGPSGVGKTLMAKTLANVLSVPFSISDCTPFTQAGYMGEDAESCVHQLLAAAQYDVAAAERGIICLDEVDKIAVTRAKHGRDIGGEGVQQALLKILEGTAVQVRQKHSHAIPPKGDTDDSTQSPMPSRTQVHIVRTDNILFICSGAFVGLEKMVMDRVSRASIGFGQPVRTTSGTVDPPFSGFAVANTHNSVLSPFIPGSREEVLYKTHLPFFNENMPTEFNPLDLATPQDLQTFGFIPELVGRIPTMVSFTPLNHELLLEILTEPRNSLLAQYNKLFSLARIELRFTTPALRAIARNALVLNRSAGARALRTEMECVLSDAMFEAPGSGVAYVLVTERAANRKEKVAFFTRSGRDEFERAFEDEEMEIDRGRDGSKGGVLCGQR